MLSRHACLSSLSSSMISHKATRYTCAHIQRRIAFPTTPRLYHLSTSFSHPRTDSIRDNSHFTSGLGLRSHLPPDSNSPGGPNHTPEISDQEWEIRTGRAIYVLRQTLPDFFSVGLVTSIDKYTGSPRPSISAHIPTVDANPHEHGTPDEDLESIYSSKVRLSYTPPTPLPPPFPKTFHIEGSPLYLASSVFVRHTLNALYSDLHVELRRVSLRPQGSSPNLPTSTGAGELQEGAGKKRKNREKSLDIGLVVTGTARVSGSPGQWEVDSTYTFSPLTGLIHLHIVNSILPAPHQAVYDSLRLSFGKVFGLGLGGGGRANGAACKGRVGSGDHKMTEGQTGGG